MTRLSCLALALGAYLLWLLDRDDDIRLVFPGVD